MKRFLALLLGVLLLLGMITGCGETKTEETEPATEKIHVQEKEETTAPSEETEGIRMVAHMELDVPGVSYVLTAVNPYADFGDTEIVINSQGAEALVRWMQHSDTLEAISEFGSETYEEPIFRVPENIQTYEGWISPANDNTKQIRLMTTSLVEQSGLLQEILPFFEEEYGYRVEIVTAEDGAGYANIIAGEADLLLMEAPETGDPFAEGNYVRQIPGFDRQISLLECPYVLCGPKTDPAKAANCADIASALEAIAGGEHLFISRGDQSAAHSAEQSLWPEHQSFDEDWYFCVDTDMGPCLTIAEEMGGYVISDKLTWLIFCSLNGII